MKPAPYDLLVIGGGAAGFFGAINVAATNPKLKILIVEKTTKLLTKVKVSGGGRCNVTHHCVSPASLSQHYPRGQRPLKNIFHQFQATDTVAWFEKRGVKLKTEEDGRMFPETDRSQTIIDCFLRDAAKFNIEIKTGCEIVGLEKEGEHFLAYASGGVFVTHQVLVAMGGHSKPEPYLWLQKLGHEIAQPIPSLFTFNDSKKELTDLMGIAVPEGEVRIAGTKFLERGAVLITHWGLSGPAVIKLSAWAAEYLFRQHYTFLALVNWTGSPETEIRNHFMGFKASHDDKQITTHPQFGLPKRLWESLCSMAGIADAKTWADVSNKSINRLIELVYACPFQIKGKTTFKEEFVTCGGVALTDIDLATMESKKIAGLYFAGEVLNIDGETGGFNFQAAWSTAWVASRAITAKLLLI